MDIQQAILSRRSVRDFLDTPVPESLLKRVIETALRSPSGGNLQPWHLHVVSGPALKRLKMLMHKRLGDGLPEQPEYDIYPRNLPSPYRDRRFEIGEALYGQLGIPRDDKAARYRWFQRNFEFFGAPVGLFCTVDAGMGPPQWSDLGMLLQSIMLLLRAEGVDSCAQESWALYPKTVGEFLELPEGRMLFAGMAIGYANADHPVNQLATPRAAIEEVVEFIG